MAVPAIEQQIPQQYDLPQPNFVGVLGQVPGDQADIATNPPQQDHEPMNHFDLPMAPGQVWADQTQSKHDGLNHNFNPEPVHNQAGARNDDVYPVTASNSLQNNNEVPHSLIHPNENHHHQAPAFGDYLPLPPPPSPPLPPPPPYQNHPQSNVQSNNYHQSYQPVRIKQHKEKPHVQVLTQAADSRSQVAESMQMMMMNQMMMQQMQGQQMQAAQMASMNQQNMQMQYQQMQANSNKNVKNKDMRGSINIKSTPQRAKQYKHRPKARPVRKPKVVAGFAPPTIVNLPSHTNTIDSVAMDNWQEATIILCFAAVGLIYLICSRAGGEEKKEDLAKKHMS